MPRKLTQEQVILDFVNIDNLVKLPKELNFVGKSECYTVKQTL